MLLVRKELSVMALGERGHWERGSDGGEGWCRGGIGLNPDASTRGQDALGGPGKESSERVVSPERVVSFGAKTLSRVWERVVRKSRQSGKSRQLRGEDAF